MNRLLLTVIACLLGSIWMPLRADQLSRDAQAFNQRIAKAKAEHNDTLLAALLDNRAVFYYNNALTDSIYAHLPEDMETLCELRDWNRYYGVWMHLINTYIYYNNTRNQALIEVQKMHADAKRRGNKYGIGIAYYMMGNVYANMNNLDESADAYEKGLALLSGLDPQPTAVADLYSYYGDVLHEQKRYKELDELTVRWMAFLVPFTSGNEFNTEEKDLLWFYYDIACVQAALGLQQLGRAETMLEEAKRRLHSDEDYLAGTWLHYMGQLRLQQGQYREALELNSRRLQLVEPDEDKAIQLVVLAQRAQILRGMGRMEEAANVYETLYLATDSISSADTKKQLNEMNTLFHVDELKMEQERLKMEQERQQFRLLMVIVGIVVVALVVFIIFRTIAARRLKRAHEKLQTTHDELLTAYDQLEETTAAKERIESDLRIARDIQMGMVPSTFPDRPDLDLYASMTPAKEVGGDLYGYVLLGDKLYFALGDVSGKGVPASLFMAQATRLFRTLANQQLMPAEICNQLNEALSGEDNETGMFVTMFIGLVDLPTGHLHFCNAGHNPPVLLTGGKAEFIEMEPNAPIGLWPGLEYEGQEIADITGCPLFVYTDGLNEAENRQQEQFTDERLLQLLEQTPFESSRQTIELLRDAVEQHRDGAEPNDDLTMLCVKVNRADQ